MIETWMKNDLKKPVIVKTFHGKLFKDDNQGNQIGVELTDNGQAVNLTGTTITGYIIRPDNQTITVAGSVSGNKASIILPSTAYAVSGEVSIAIKAGSTTIGACSIYVR